MAGKGPFGCSGQGRPLGRGPINESIEHTVTCPCVRNWGQREGISHILKDLFQGPDSKAPCWIGSVLGGKRREAVLCVAWPSPDATPREVRTSTMAWHGWGW